MLEKKLSESQSEIDAIKLRHQFIESDKDHKIEVIGNSTLCIFIFVECCNFPLGF